jgi:hypothetical protein
MIRIGAKISHKTEQFQERCINLTFCSNEMSTDERKAIAICRNMATKRADANNIQSARIVARRGGSALWSEILNVINTFLVMLHAAVGPSFTLEQQMIYDILQNA